MCSHVLWSEVECWQTKDMPSWQSEERLLQGKAKRHENTVSVTCTHDDEDNTSLGVAVLRQSCGTKYRRDNFGFSKFRLHKGAHKASFPFGLLAAKKNDEEKQK